MHLPLALHILIHFILAVLAGWLIGRHFNKIKLGIIAGIFGGFLIDLDHVLEYLFTFGPHFNFISFFAGQEFLASNRILLIFHAWEYIPALLIIALIFRRRKNIYIFLLALTLGGTIHLAADCLINNYLPRNYSLIYRASLGFSASRLLTPEQYEENFGPWPD